jgi:hypothetical protein
MKNKPLLIVFHIIIICLVIGFVGRYIFNSLFEYSTPSNQQLCQEISERLGIENDWHIIFSYIENEITPGMTYEKVLSEMKQIGFYESVIVYPEMLEPDQSINEMHLFVIRIIFIDQDVSDQLGEWEFGFKNGILHGSNCSQNCPAWHTSG